VYGVHPGDVFWAASDVGWVVGHSYIVYAPLLHRCTTILYEGKPVRTPDAAQFWRMIEKYQVNVFFTAPTAIRAIKKEDPDADLIHQFDLSSLRQMFLAGERCDVATLEYAQKALQRPVIDHWWQTESGWPMLANPVGGGLFEVRPGSAGKPVPGFQIEVVHPDGSPTAIGEEGAVVIRLPLPPGCMPTLWQANDRFKESYLEAYEGFYNTGDGGYIDQEGYVYITGRLDDVINVAGHRLSTADMEEIVAAHHAVAECAVVGVENDLKGQVPVGLVILKSGKEMDIAMLEHELANMVRDRLGPIACFRTVHLVQKLPKTRSGKILRRTIRCIADGKPYQVPGTIEDHTVIDDLHLLFGTERHGNA
jgi:acyl-coenzyme A synthetase/AMP-(fatty) acid ligase